MDKNSNFFSDNMALLYQLHGEKVIVIKQQSIIGVYDNFRKAKKAAKKIGDTEIFIIQNLCKDKAVKPQRKFIDRFRIQNAACAS